MVISTDCNLHWARNQLYFNWIYTDPFYYIFVIFQFIEGIFYLFPLSKPNKISNTNRTDNLESLAYC